MFDIISTPMVMFIVTLVCIIIVFIILSASLGNEGLNKIKDSDKPEYKIVHGVGETITRRNYDEPIPCACHFGKYVPTGRYDNSDPGVSPAELFECNRCRGQIYVSLISLT